MKTITRLIGTCCTIFALAAFTGCATTSSSSVSSDAAPQVTSSQKAGSVSKAPEPVADQQKEIVDPAAAKKQKSIRAIHSMKKMGVKAIDHLTELSHMRDKDIRTAAVETLGTIDSPCAIDPLISALADDDPRIRESAVRLLIYRGPLMTRVHVDRLVYIMRNAHKCWPDPAMEGGTIYANHYAGKVLSNAKSPFISPEIAQEGYEAMVHY